MIKEISFLYMSTFCLIFAVLPKYDSESNKEEKIANVTMTKISPIDSADGEFSGMSIQFHFYAYASLKKVSQNPHNRLEHFPYKL